MSAAEKDINTALSVRLAEIQTAGVPPIAYENAEYTPVEGTLYLREAFLPNIKDAQITIAISIMAGNDPLSTVDRAVKREKVDVLEVEYMDNASISTVIRSIGNAMRKLVTSSTGGNNIRTIRG